MEQERRRGKRGAGVRRVPMRLTWQYGRPERVDELGALSERRVLGAEVGGVDGALSKVREGGCHELAN